jgi:hypothetical protein
LAKILTDIANEVTAELDKQPIKISSGLNLLLLLALMYVPQIIAFKQQQKLREIENK